MIAETLARRSFLKSLPGGMAALGLVEGLERTGRLFASQLQALPNSADIDPGRVAEFHTLDPRLTYLNHGSIGTIPRPVQEARDAYLRLCETNPWLYMWNEPWEAPRQEVRAKAARLLNCHPDELAITHNTTEGLNILASGLDLSAGDEVLFSSLNHAGASICWEFQAPRRGFSVRRFPFPLREAPRLSATEWIEVYAQEIRPETRVLVIPHVDNVVGCRYPLRRMAEMARSKGVRYVAVDGAQAVGMIPVDLASSGVDFYATSPHKWLQSPKGLGLLFVRRSVQERLSPLWVTWGQARWKGSARRYEDYGTRNLPEVLALGDAIDFQNRLGVEPKERHFRALHSRALEMADGSPHLTWRSPRDPELWSSLYSIEIVGRDSREAFKELYEKSGLVFRAFHQEDLNACRLSLHAANGVGDLEAFADAAANLRAG